MPHMPETLASTLPVRRCWFQFRIRTLLIAVAVLAVPGAWVAHEKHRIVERRNAFDRMSAVDLESQLQAACRVLLFGDDRIGYTTTILDHATTDADLRHYQDLTHLESLRLRRTQLTDTGLARLSKIRTLKVLTLDRS